MVCLESLEEGDVGDGVMCVCVCVCQKERMYVAREPPAYVSFGEAQSGRVCGSRSAAVAVQLFQPVLRFSWIPWLRRG